MADEASIAVLRQHIEDMFDAHAREHALEHDALVLARTTSQEALRTALVAMDKRLDSMNEIRSALGDMAARAVSRTEWETNHKILQDKLDSKVTALDQKYDERSRALEHLVWMGMGAVALAGVVVNLILYLLKK